MVCPRDNTALTPKNFKLHQIQHCSCCKGVWLPGEMVPTLLSSSANGRIRNLKQIKKSPLSCPRQCSDLQEMQINGILLDACPACGGVWLDRGEIEAVQKNTSALRYGRKSAGDSVLFSIADGISCGIPDLLEALLDGLFDGI